MDIYKDAIVPLEGMDFPNEEALSTYFDREDVINHLIKTYKKELPFLFLLKLNGLDTYYQHEPEKQGIKLDWKFFSEQQEITKEDILDEENVEKRRLLMTEYGITEFLEDITVIDDNPNYGTLISATVEEETVKLVKVIDATLELEGQRDYYYEKGLLTEDGYRIYYLFVPDDVMTAKEAVEWSFNVPKGFLPDDGFTEAS